MTLSAGQRLGPYEVLSAIGAGGMGEIYRARDPRLGREIAIKVLPAELASDPGRLKRFEREARAASALSHPNIITVYDVGRTDSISYMVIELVDGKTLHEMILPGPLPMRKLLEIAAQISDGLAAAHEAGIVHRDLKPRNVMVSRSGFVKILDFGLARVEPAPVGLATSGSDTVPEPPLTPGTTPGLILGTSDYMSPEQARGKPLDFHSDQFSFGAVLYEMATGRRAFGRATPVDTLTAIVREEPTPVIQLRPDAPPPLRWIIERCLAKSASERYASTRDLARELQALKEHLQEISGVKEVAAASRKPFRIAAPFLAAGLAALVAVALWMSFGKSHRLPQPEFRRLTFRDGVVRRALFVPKSNSILYTASWDGQTSRTYLTLPESRSADRPLDAGAQLPMAYSEDSAQVLVLLGSDRAAINARGTLAWWPALGGSPRRILDGAGWADWAEGSRLLAVVRDTGSVRLLEIRDAEGTPKRTLFQTSGAIAYVRFSPDGRHVGFIHHPSRHDDAGQVYVAETDGSGSKAVTPLLGRCAGLDWNRRTGEIWVTASRSSPYSSALYAIGPAGGLRMVYSLPDYFVLQRISTGGDRCLFVSNVTQTSLAVRRGGEAWRDLSWLGWSMVYDISPDEKNLLFLDGGTTERTSGTYFRPVDSGEAVKLWDGEPGHFSPDGRSIIALTPPVSGPQQLVLVPFPSGPSRQLTFSKVSHYSAPSFAGPDTLLFVRSEAGRNEVWRMKTDGTGGRSLGAAGCDGPVANPSGKAFLCTGQKEGTLFLYPMEKGPGRKLHELPAGHGFLHVRWNAAGDQALAITDDGRLLALDSASGALVREEAVPLEEALRKGSPIAAALNASGTIQAFSVARSSSALYLCSGL